MQYIIYYDLLHNANNRYPSSKRIKFASGIRKFYNVSGILVVKPTSNDGLYATFRCLGGSPDPSGNHNHDDAGSYQILINGTRVAQGW